MKEIAHITENGNILRNSPQGMYFQTPKGDFLRECSKAEGAYLTDNDLLLEAEIEFPNNHPENFPTWHCITTVMIINDKRDYRWETSVNGGNYSFATYHDWFVAKMPNGKWQFRFVEHHSTSSEFAFDELSGNFQNNLGTFYPINTEGNVSYQSQIGRGWDDENSIPTNYVDEVLEKISVTAEFEVLWNEEYTYIPSRWDEDSEEYSEPALKFTQKKQIISRLRELGCDLREGYKRRDHGTKGWIKNNRR